MVLSVRKRWPSAFAPRMPKESRNKTYSPWKHKSITWERILIWRSVILGKFQFGKHWWNKSCEMLCPKMKKFEAKNPNWYHETPARGNVMLHFKSGSHSWLRKLSGTVQKTTLMIFTERTAVLIAFIKKGTLDYFINTLHWSSFIIWWVLVINTAFKEAKTRRLHWFPCFKMPSS